MKFSKSSLILSLLLFFAATLPVAACGPFYFLPKYYKMYRVSDPDEWSSEKTRNCRAWRDITSPVISEEDIHEVVYKYSIVQMECLRLGINDSSNTFAHWLAQNKRKDIIDYLILAKQYEHLCAEIASPWYYPGTEGVITAEELLLHSKIYANGALKERYDLLRIRSLMLLGEDSTLVAFYDSIAPTVQHDVLQQMMLEYVRGACQNLGWEEREKQYRGEGYYARLLADFQKEIKQQEYIGVWRSTSWECAQPDILMYPEFPDSLSSEMLNTARQIAEKGLSKRVAEWAYTAAFIADMRGETKEALRWLSRAEQAPHSDFLDESLRVMRIYLDAKRSHYDEKYWERLHWQLTWLKEKIKNNLNPDVVYRTIHSRGAYLDINQSYYYWNDVLRRILLGEVCPRLRQQGQTVRALQLANMADNILRKICINRYKEFPLTEKDKEYKNMMWLKELHGSEYQSADAITRPSRLCYASNFYTKKRFCISDSLLLSHDREFFDMADDCAARQTEQLYNAITHPRTAFDRFLAQNSLTDKDFFCDVIGTQYLRERNYPAAERWLGKVSFTFQSAYGFTENAHRLPFEAYKTQDNNAPDYKYNFAKEMCRLEQEIKRETDADRRGLLLLRYGMGMKNSVEWCWSLTEYGCSEMNEARNRRRKETAEEARRIIDRALNTVRSREAKAQAQYKLLNFKAAARYADTPTGDFVRRSCDRLVDYKYSQKWMQN